MKTIRKHESDSAVTSYSPRLWYRSSLPVLALFQFPLLVFSYKSLPFLPLCPHRDPRLAGWPHEWTCFQLHTWPGLTSFSARDAPMGVSVGF